MATKAKKTTRSSKAATPPKTTTTVGTPSDKKSGTTSPALDAAVKKVAAAPSRLGTPEPAKLSGITRSTDPAAVNKKELVGRVAKRANLRPNQVREVTEAVLEELGLALVNGEELKLPKFGKMQVKRKKDIGGADVMVCKLRRKKEEDSDPAPLAPAAE